MLGAEELCIHLTVKLSSRNNETCEWKGKNKLLVYDVGKEINVTWLCLVS